MDEDHHSSRSRSGMMNIGKYLLHYTPNGIPEYRDGPMSTTIIPLTVKELTKEITKNVHTEVEDGR